MIGDMPTKSLQLKKRGGYYRTAWTDDHGRRHHRTFGKVRRTAEIRFERFRQQWRMDSHVRNPSADVLTVAQACERFQAHAVEFYVKADGTPTGEARNFEHATAHLIDLYGDTPADQFGAKDLEAVQFAMADDGLSHGVVIQRVQKIRHVYRWLALREMVPAVVAAALAFVPALKPGQRGVRVTNPVQPAPAASVWSLVEVAPPTLAAMVRFAWWTGARPGEVCDLRPVDLDTTGKVWQYRPASHKNQHHGKDRLIFVGPQAQAAIEPFLKRDLHAYVFSPRECVAQSRKSPHADYWSIGTRYKRYGDHYRTEAFGYAIRRLCERHGIPHFSPNQLRHAALQRVREQFGLEVAQAVGGHSRLETTQVYAGASVTRAVRAMESAG